MLGCCVCGMRGSRDRAGRLINLRHPRPPVWSRTTAIVVVLFGLVLPSYPPCSSRFLILARVSRYVLPCFDLRCTPCGLFQRTP